MTCFANDGVAVMCFVSVDVMVTCFVSLSVMDVSLGVMVDVLLVGVVVTRFFQC